MRIRAAEAGDAETIARNHHDAWQAGYRGLVADHLIDGLDLDARIDRWRRTIAADADGHGLLVVVDDEGVWGHVAVGPASRPGDPGGEVHSLYVAPGRWGHGYGRALLVAGRQALVDLGYDPLGLWVIEGNERAQALYESDGWVLAGARELLVIGDVDYGVHERKMRWTG